MAVNALAAAGDVLIAFVCAYAAKVADWFQEARFFLLFCGLC